MLHGGKTYETPNLTPDLPRSSPVAGLFNTQKRKTMTTQTTKMIMLMQLNGIRHPTPALANALIQLLNSIYQDTP